MHASERFAGRFRRVVSLPGFGREQLHVRVEGDTLSIEAAMNLALPPGMTARVAEVH